jgi:hypothetical protein
MLAARKVRGGAPTIVDAEDLQRHEFGRTQLHETCGMHIRQALRPVLAAIADGSTAPDDDAGISSPCGGPEPYRLCPSP